jgi:phosphoribosylanthranilate isomerase
VHVRIKICGVTTADAVDASVACGADAVGFIFAESPRRVSAEEARALALRIPAFVTTVAVFRHPGPTDITDVLRTFSPDLVQSEVDLTSIQRLPPGVRVLPVCHDGPAYHERATAASQLSGVGSTVLLEAAGRGGRGMQPDWEHAAALARRIPLVLAGGLTPSNVGDAIRRVRPYAVDVSSGVEITPGIKDPGLIAEFVRAVRRATRHINATTVALT